jgi:hypothetical protein
LWIFSSIQAVPLFISSPVYLDARIGNVLKFYSNLILYCQLFKFSSTFELNALCVFNGPRVLNAPTNPNPKQSYARSGDATPRPRWGYRPAPALSSPDVVTAWIECSVLAFSRRAQPRGRGFFSCPGARYQNSNHIARISLSSFPDALLSLNCYHNIIIKIRKKTSPDWKYPIPHMRWRHNMHDDTTRAYDTPTTTGYVPFFFLSPLFFATFLPLSCYLHFFFFLTFVFFFTILIHGSRDDLDFGGWCKLKYTCIRHLY